MKTKILLFMLLLLLLAPGALFAAESVRIAGIDIPLPQGALALPPAPSDAASARVSSYTVELTLDEAIGFYDSFLKERGFMVIGGKDEMGYAVAVKKDAVMFAVNIYPQDNKTVIEFIW